jgi:cytochrome b561
MMATVILTATLLNPEENAVMVQDQLKSDGVKITENQAFDLSHKFEDKMWNVHKHLGYGLTILFLARILIELVVPGEEKVSFRVKNAIGLYKQSEDSKSEYRHYVWVKRGYLLFYILLFIVILTGLGLALGHPGSFFEEIQRDLKVIHSIFQSFIYLFVLLHLFGYYY